MHHLFSLPDEAKLHQEDINLVARNKEHPNPPLEAFRVTGEMEDKRKPRVKGYEAALRPQLRRRVRDTRHGPPSRPDRSSPSPPFRNIVKSNA